MTTGLLIKNTLALPGRVRLILNGTETRRATIGSLMSGISGQAVLIITGILAARILGPEGRGALAMIIVFSALVAQVGGLGIPQAATYYISKTNRAMEILKMLQSLIIGQMFFLSITHLIIVLIYIQGAPTEIKAAALYTLFATPGNLARAYGQGILQGQGRYRLFNIIRLLPVVSYSILLVILFVADGGNLPIVAAVWSLSNLFTGFMVLILAYTCACHDNIQFTDRILPTRSEMTRFGLKGLFGWSSPLDSFRIDHLIAGLMFAPGTLGLYVVGQAFTNIPKFISQSIGVIAYPTISSKKNMGGTKHLIWRFFCATALLNSIIAIILWLLMPWIILLFFGGAFADSVPLARILIIGTLIVSLRHIIVECERGLGRPEISTYSELCIYPCLIASIPLLIVPFGITGMALAVVFGQVIAFMISAFFILKNNR